MGLVDQQMKRRQEVARAREGVDVELEEWVGAAELEELRRRVKELEGEQERRRKLEREKKQRWRKSKRQPRRVLAIEDHSDDGSTRLARPED